jgi:hypothetical protein
MLAVVRSSRGLKSLALALAVANVVLWYAVPWVRNAIDTRLASPYRPGVFNGVQELLVYYDPWLARGVFPAVYTLGFVAIAFLFRPNPDPSRATSGHAAVGVLLLSFEAVWIFLIVFAILFRGPDWNLYWPWEPWIPKVVALNCLNFSSLFWEMVGGRIPPGSSWAMREAPGLLLLAGYFSLGLLVARIWSRGASYYPALCCFVILMLFVLAPLVFRKAVLVAGAGRQELWIWPGVLGLILVATYLFFRQMRAWQRAGMSAPPMAYWRCALLVFLVQVAALVPVKVLLYWAFDLKFFIFVPGNGWSV